MREYPRSGLLTLTADDQMTTLGEVHETAPIYLAKLLTLGAREIPNQEITLQFLNNLLKDTGPLKW